MYVILQDNQIVRDGNVFMLFTTEHDAIQTIRTTYSKVGPLTTFQDSCPHRKVLEAPDGTLYTIQFIQPLAEPTHF